MNQASILTLKNDDEAIFTVNVALAQILPLVNSPPNIDEYECAEDEVKLLCPLYDKQSGHFLGLEKRLAAISIRGNSNEYFLSYGFDKEKSKVLFSTYKMMLPNIFQSTYFKKYKDFLKSDDKGEFSTLFCYLPLTTDRKESLNQHKGNVQLHLITCEMTKFEEFSKTNSDFFLQHLESHDPKERAIAREIMLNFIKHVANISNSNLNRNANALRLTAGIKTDEVVGMESHDNRFNVCY